MSISILPLALLAVAAFAGPRPAGADEPLIFPPDQPADCLHIRLELKVDIPKKHVDAQATIDVQAARELRSIRLDAVDFAVSKVALARDSQGPVEAKYVNDGESITVSCDPPLPRGTRASVQIAYTLDAPERGLHFFAPSKDEPDVPAIVWSQGEATENRYWFPCFDHPAEMQTTELIVTAAAGNEVVSNGTLLSKSADSRTGDMVFHWKQDKPHVAYLVTLVIGPFHVETETWRGKPIRYYANPKYKDWIKRSFANTVPMLEFFSERIGVEYPWDQYAQVAAYGFGGGMENTSATTMGEWVLHDERSILDGSSDGLIAHEMAHQWFGDLLTCKDWAHIWLNEGFASYLDPLWIEHDKGRDEFLRDMHGNARSAMRSGKNKPIVHRRYGNPDSQFDGRAYGKGAWVLHMLRCQVGDETFFRAINRYVTSHRHQCVETADLRRAFEIETGRNFERFFYDWTERPGHPVITVDYEWIEDDKTSRIVVKQTQKEEAFCFPLELELRTEGGNPVSVRRDVREKEETILVPLASAPTLVRFDPRYTLLCELTQNKGRDLWAAQLTQDDNPVARLQAAQYFAKRHSDRDATMLAEALEKEKFWGVQVEIVDALQQIGGHAACEALIAGLKADHPRVRRACAEGLDEFKDDEAAAALRAIVERGDPSYDVEAAAIASYAGLRPEDGFGLLKGLLGRESRFEVIRSAVLEGLGRLRDPRAIDLLVEWTKGDKSRHCRPDAIAALAEIVANTTCDEAVVSRVVTALAACVNNQSRQIRRSAVSGLGSLGGAARSALPALEALQTTESSRRGAREALENAIKRIRENQPASVEVNDVRKELEKLRKENEDLKKRLKKLEARASDRE